jgi:hypothetical protein
MGRLEACRAPSPSLLLFLRERPGPHITRCEGLAGAAEAPARDVAEPSLSAVVRDAVALTSSCLLTHKPPGRGAGRKRWRGRVPAQDGGRFLSRTQTQPSVRPSNACNLGTTDTHPRPKGSLPLPDSSPKLLPDLGAPTLGGRALFADSCRTDSQGSLSPGPCNRAPICSFFLISWNCRAAPLRGVPYGV